MLPSPFPFFSFSFSPPCRSKRRWRGLGPSPFFFPLFSFFYHGRCRFPPRKNRGARVPLFSSSFFFFYPFVSEATFFGRRRHPRDHRLFLSPSSLPFSFLLSRSTALLSREKRGVEDGLLPSLPFFSSFLG